MKSRSQYNDEMIVIAEMGWENKTKGTYVEIGALDGMKYTNTLHLHTCLQWTGLLVEASPSNYEMLVNNVKLTRPDVHLHFGAVCTPPQILSLR